MESPFDSQPVPECSWRIPHGAAVSPLLTSPDRLLIPSEYLAHAVAGMVQNGGHMGPMDELYHMLGVIVAAASSIEFIAGGMIMKYGDISPKLGARVIGPLTLDERLRLLQFVMEQTPETEGCAAILAAVADAQQTREERNRAVHAMWSWADPENTQLRRISTTRSGRYVFRDVDLEEVRDVARRIFDLRIRFMELTSPGLTIGVNFEPDD